MKDENTELQQILENEESQTVECKRSATKPQKLLEAVVALANTSGGKLIIGLEDPSKARGKKRLIGIEEDKSDNISEFKKLIEKEIDPPIVGYKIEEIKITNTAGNQDKIVVVDIKKSK